MENEEFLMEGCENHNDNYCFKPLDTWIKTRESLLQKCDETNKGLYCSYSIENELIQPEICLNTEILIENENNERECILKTND